MAWPGDTMGRLLVSTTKPIGLRKTRRSDLHGAPREAKTRYAPSLHADPDVCMSHR